MSITIKLKEGSKVKLSRLSSEVVIDIIDGDISESHARMYLYLTPSEAKNLGKKLIEIGEL